MAVQTTSLLPANLHSYYHKVALSVLEPRLQLYQFGKKAPLPRGNGKLVKWLLWSAVDGSTTPLTEGQNPTEISQTTTNVTATIAQYGQFSKFSDLLEMTAIDNVIKSAAERFGWAARKTIESLIIAELDSALTTRFVNGAADVDALTAEDVPSMKEFLKAVIALKKNYVGPHESGKYIAVLSAAHEYDILAEENMHAWLSVRERAAQDKAKVVMGEIGELFGMRFIVSDLMSSVTNTGGVVVHNSYVIGEECYGVVEIDGKASKEGFQLIVKNPGREDTSNPLNMFSTVGYKIPGFVCKNFAPSRGIVLRGASSHA